MNLTDKSIKNLEIKDKSYKIADGGGLYLLVNPNNSKYWRLKYRIANKEKTLSIGIYPQISLKEARIKREIAKKDLKNNIDPSGKKKL